MPLTEEQRRKLDGIVSQMEANGESEQDIIFVVSDFKQKYGNYGGKSREQLIHEHNINREAEADTEQGHIAVAARAIAELPRAVGMFGGPPGAAAGEAVAQGIEQAGGAREDINTASVAAQAAIPEAVRLVGKAARPVAKYLYSGALKMPTTMKVAKREQILETGLREGRIATPRSLAKSQNKVKEIEKEIDAVIATDPKAPIDPNVVAQRVDAVSPRFQTVNPKADQRILANTKKEFVKSYPTLEAAEAQEIKKKTYRVLGEKAYGEQKTASKEGWKALARGLKEELEGLFPELKGLNKQASELIDLNKALERAAARIANRDVMGIGVPIKTAAFGKAGFLAGLMDAPGVKQRLAIAIDRARHLEKFNQNLTTGISRTATLPSVYGE